ncbi:MAG TPA: hypothetical protein VG454_14035, partial [Gemmatimonadales bacterium]|nr:hypothetical protein [Gemmatimonadales bacterium]
STTMPRPLHTTVLLAPLTTLAITVHAQTCTDPHYRWTVKTTTSLQGQAATATTPSAMLGWPPLDLYPPPRHTRDCTPRTDRELTIYAVTGWARSWHIEQAPSGDLDWHIELTQSQNTKSTKCIVVEIPDPQYGAIFATARQQFLNLIVNSTVAKKKIVPPVRLTVTGPAFFDAQHRSARNSGLPPSGHGNCNSSDSALWEIHPVYEITQS